MKLVRNSVFIWVVFLLLTSTIAVGSSHSDFCDDEKSVSYCTEPIVLVTGFGPFDSHEINPSQLIAEALDGQEIYGAQIVGICLPVDFNDSVAVVIQTIEDINPVIVISIGLAARHRFINVEKLGINLKRDPYDKENGSRFYRINQNGPFFRQSSIPVRSIAQKLRRAGIPARQSWFAGTYICNALLYGVLSHITENELPIKAGFLHVPLLSSQDPRGMEFDTMLDATKIAIMESLQQL